MVSKSSSNNMKTWIKNNVFGILTVLGVVLTYVITFAGIPDRVGGLENKVSINSTRLTSLETSIVLNNADHEYIKERIDEVKEKISEVKETTDQILKLHLTKTAYIDSKPTNFQSVKK